MALSAALAGEQGDFQCWSWHGLKLSEAFWGWFICLSNGNKLPRPQYSQANKRQPKKHSSCVWPLSFSPRLLRTTRAYEPHIRHFGLPRTRWRVLGQRGRGPCYLRTKRRKETSEQARTRFLVSPGELGMLCAPISELPPSRVIPDTC